jgi:Acetyltransferase (GNAT) domain
MTAPELGPEPLPLRGRRVYLEPLRSSHVGPLFAIVASEAMVGRWPRNEIVLTRGTFEQVLWRLASLNYVVRRTADGEVIGLVQGINEDWVNQTIGLSILFDPRVWKRGWPLEAVILAIHVFFEVNGFRKLYCQVAESTRQALGPTFERWLVREATYERHEVVGEGYEDWHIFSLFRRDWDPTIVTLITHDGPRRP